MASGVERIKTASLNRLEAALRLGDATKIRAALTPAGANAPRYVWQDGKGLALHIDGRSLTASWVYRYSSGFRTNAKGKRVQRVVMLGLGGFPDLPLADARDQAAKKRVLRKTGKDPLKDKRDKERADELKKARDVTLETALRDWVEGHKSRWRSPKTLDRMDQLIRLWIGPKIGHLPVASIGLPEVLAVLRQPTDSGKMFWLAHPESSAGARQLLESGLALATINSQREGDNPARWDRWLDQVLPPHSRKTAGHKGLDYKDVPAFVVALRQRSGPTALAMEMVLLCTTRKMEMLKARVRDFDFENGLYRIPDSRMKTDEEHAVPLSSRAVDIARQLCDGRKADDFVFVSPTKKGAHLSEGACKSLLERMGMEDKTSTHGLRKSFRTWAAENGVDREHAERCLAHKIGNKEEQTYNLSNLIRQRAPIMQAWCDFLENKPARATAAKRRKAA